MAQGEREREAQEALARVGRESETIGSLSLGRIGRRIGDHFAASDAASEEGGAPDAIEVWGRRIGRTLSLIGVVVLAYLVGAQLRLW